MYPGDGQGREGIKLRCVPQPAFFISVASEYSTTIPGTESMSILVVPKKCVEPLIDPDFRTFVVIFAQPRKTRVREKNRD